MTAGRIALDAKAKFVLRFADCAVKPKAFPYRVDGFGGRLVYAGGVAELVDALSVAAATVARGHRGRV